MTKLTLSEALKEGRLEAFVQQAESDGIGAVERAEFDARLERLIKAPPQEDRTSRSPARGGSRGTQTR